MNETEVRWCSMTVLLDAHAGISRDVGIFQISAMYVAGRASDRPDGQVHQAGVSAEEVHLFALLYHFFAAKLVQHWAMSACLKQL